VPLVVGAMHAWDPAVRAAVDAWGDLPGTVRAVRSTIYLPPNSDLIALATDLFAPSALVPGPLMRPLDVELGTISSGVFGLASHDIPLIRRLVPGVTAVHHARGLWPWGYSIGYHDGDLSVSLIALMGGNWGAHWTFDAWGDSTEIHVAFPPSYVTAGSSEATVHDTMGSRTWRSGLNGYQHEWLQLAQAVEDGGPLAIPVSTALEDLRHTVALADAAVSWRRSHAEAAA